MALRTTVETVKVTNISADAESSPLVRQSPPLSAMTATHADIAEDTGERIENSAGDKQEPQSSKVTMAPVHTAGDQRSSESAGPSKGRKGASNSSSSISEAPTAPKAGPNVSSKTSTTITFKQPLGKLKPVTHSTLPKGGRAPHKKMSPPAHGSKADEVSTVNQQDVESTSKGNISDGMSRVQHSSEAVRSNLSRARPFRAAKASALEALTQRTQFQNSSDLSSVPASLSSRDARLESPVSVLSSSSKNPEMRREQRPHEIQNSETKLEDRSTLGPNQNQSRTMKRTENSDVESNLDPVSPQPAAAKSNDRHSTRGLKPAFASTQNDLRAENIDMPDDEIQVARRNGNAFRELVHDATSQETQRKPRNRGKQARRSPESHFTMVAPAIQYSSRSKVRRTRQGSGRNVHQTPQQTYDAGDKSDRPTISFQKSSQPLVQEIVSPRALRQSGRRATRRAYSGMAARTPRVRDIPGASKEDAIVLSDYKSSSLSDESPTPERLTKVAPTQHSEARPKMGINLNISSASALEGSASAAQKPTHPNKGLSSSLSSMTAENGFGNIAPLVQYSANPEKKSSTDAVAVNVSGGEGRRINLWAPKRPSDAVTDTVPSVQSTSSPQSSNLNFTSNIADNVESALDAIAAKHVKPRHPFLEDTTNAGSAQGIMSTVPAGLLASSTGSPGVVAGYAAGGRPVSSPIGSSVQVSPRTITRPASQNAMPPASIVLEREKSDAGPAISTELQHSMATAVTTADLSGPDSTQKRRTSQKKSQEPSTKQARMTDSYQANASQKLLRKYGAPVRRANGSSVSINSDGSPIPVGVGAANDLAVAGILSRNRGPPSFRLSAEPGTDRHGLRMIPNGLVPSHMAHARPANGKDEFDSFLRRDAPKNRNNHGRDNDNRDNLNTASIAHVSASEETDRRGEFQPGVQSWAPATVSAGKKITKSLKRPLQQDMPAAFDGTNPMKSRRIQSRADRQLPPLQPLSNKHVNGEEEDLAVWRASLAPSHAKHFDQLVQQARRSTQHLVDTERTAQTSAIAEVARNLEELLTQETQRHAQVHEVLTSAIRVLRPHLVPAEAAEQDNTHDGVLSLKKRISQRLEATMAELL